MKNASTFVASIATILALARIAAFAADSSGEDCPQLLGPHANGISSETGLFDKWPKSGPPVLWDKAVGTGYSAPSVRGNLLVLQHRIANEEIVEAFEADSGKGRWRYSYPSHFQDPYGYNSGPRCTPLLTSNRCYTFGA